MLQTGISVQERSRLDIFAEHGFDLDSHLETLSLVATEEDPFGLTFLRIFHHATLDDLQKLGMNLASETRFSKGTTDLSSPLALIDHSVKKSIIECHGDSSPTEWIGLTCHRLLGRCSQVGWSRAVSLVQAMLMANKTSQWNQLLISIDKLREELIWLTEFLEDLPEQEDYPY